ncbi:MAG: WGR domain-containing protein [Gordonia amarae]
MGTTEILPSSCLFFTEGSSDKEYRAWVTETDGGFLVNFAYGRRGAALKTGTKTQEPVAYDAAVATYDKLVKSKTSKGYTEDTAGTPYLHSDRDGSVSGVFPQLLNVADQDAANEAISSDSWCMQEKFDGRRMMLRKSGDTVEAINKLGLIVGVSEPVVRAAASIDADFIIDGEIIGDTLYAFDILECHLRGALVLPLSREVIENSGGDLRGATYRGRYRVLADLIAFNPDDAIVTAPSWNNPSDKRQKLAELRDGKAEGVVFKNLESAYAPGRPNSGGPQLKFKFVDTLSALVSAINDKRSVGLGLHGADGLTFVGNVTIPANHEVPEVGAVVEVRYLYANPMLFQPVYLGVRDDILPEECVMAQVKFKGDAG